MKVRFRIALIVLVVGLVVTTVSAIGIFSFLSSRAAAHELAGQVMTQTTLGIDLQIQRLLTEGGASTALTAQMVEAGQLKPADFPKDIAIFDDLMRVHHRVTSFFVGLEATGEAAGVSRLKGGQLMLWETSRNPATRQLDLHEAELPPSPDAGAATQPVAATEPAPASSPTPATRPAETGPDIRGRPWYVAAKKLHAPIWTDTYLFLGVGGLQNVVGVTQARPIYRPGGALDAVVMADFDVGELSRFLQRLPVGKNGYAFIVELRPDGTRRVVAHPHPEILSAAPGSPDAPGLTSIAHFADPRAREFLTQVPSLEEIERTGGVGAERFRVDGRRYIGSYRRIQGDRAPRWLICAVMPEEDVLGYANRSARLTFFITLGALALAIALAIAVSRQVARPLEYLVVEASAVARLRLKARPVVHSYVKEVDRLAAAAEEMKAGLRSFQKYVPADLVRGLLDSGQEAVLGGERRAVSIFFSDIADFTAISESLPTEALVAHLGDYLGAVSDEIAVSGGTVDKFIGDAVMAFWGAPDPNPRHAASACIAAWRVQARLAELRQRWRLEGKPAYHTRIGVHTGEAVVGNIGSADRMNYTIVGDAVNLASRLEGLNKHYGTNVLVSEDAYRQADGAIVARPLDWVSVKGRSKPIRVYEMLGLAGETDDAARRLCDDYAAALKQYRARDWAGAIAALTSILAGRPDDLPAAGLLTRCRQCLQSPPGPDWDGVQRMTSK